MLDDAKDVAENLLKNTEKMQRERMGKCKNPAWGLEAPDNVLFKCDFCGADICSECHNRTNDFDAICRDCIKAKGLTSADLQLSLDDV